MERLRNKKQTRKRKRDLVAPVCAENCQVNHTIEQSAALLQCSVAVVERMLSTGILLYVLCSVGLKRKSRRVPHPAIRQLQQRAI